MEGIIRFKLREWIVGYSEATAGEPRQRSRETGRAIRG